MPVVQEQFLATSRGGILYDASRVRKPGDELFERGHWSAAGALEEVSGGRGSIAIVRAGEEHGHGPRDERWVLRHYRRGGWAAKLSRDRYLWTGAARTRSFLEWRLLVELRRRGLPGPAPVAARYVRAGSTYAADLITEYLPATRTLADSIADEPLPQDAWREVGRTIAAFHREGVHHADLNAHNILLSANPLDTGASAPSPVYLLDFDRGRIRPRGPWEAQVLNRLRRSLEKIRRQRAANFGEGDWRRLMEGYLEAVSG